MLRQSAASLVLVVCIAAYSPGVSAPSAAGLEALAKEFSSAADHCLLDVRDHRLKFESSRSCRSLGPIHLRYVEAGGRAPNTPCRVELLVETGRATAWIALAVSKTGDPSLNIW
jgi:hypothetical protein